MVHEERFPPTGLSAGCGFRKETIASIRRNGRDAPIPAIRGAAMNRVVRPTFRVRSLTYCHVAPIVLLQGRARWVRVLAWSAETASHQQSLARLEILEE